MTDPLPDLDGLNLVELLDLLAPVPEPARVSLWPATPIWLVLGAVIATALLWLVVVGWRRWRATAPRRQALHAARAALRAEGGDPSAVAVTLRRTALALYGRNAVAGLSGAEWLAFLRDTGADLDEQTGQVLLAAPYAPTPPSQADAARLAQAARGWLARQPQRERRG